MVLLSFLRSGWGSKLNFVGGVPNILRYATAGLAPGIMIWGGIGFHCRTLLVRIPGTLNCQRYMSEVLEPVVFPYIQCLPAAIFQQVNADLTWQAMFRSNCFLGLLVLLIYRQSKTCDPRLHNDWPGMHRPLLHQINFGNL
ncbi:uncharacterized protein TNCV_873821 [Trichonephila clavipes]|nr:uncharacterized protein TNCV_873821 [Trichonephila clavipes]